MKREQSDEGSGHLSGGLNALFLFDYLSRSAGAKLSRSLSSSRSSHVNILEYQLKNSTSFDKK
jgi:hypothetical protein